MKIERDPKFKEFDYIEYIPEGKRLIIAGSPKSNPDAKPLGMIFMVEDCKDPQIPGYPAYCVGGNGNIRRCEKFIKTTYKRLNFKPKHLEYMS